MSRKVLCSLLATLLFGVAANRVLAQPAPNDDILPPVIPWDGASKKLVVPNDHEWVTHFEKSGLSESPSYRETMVWLERLAAASEYIAMESLGKTAQGRDIWLIVATKSRERSPDSLRRTGKPILFAQAGIHSGEIDGKDAGLMFLRDLTVVGTKSDLLDGAHFLFVPIFNIDGHERSSEFSRVNQRGPKVAGWRTTARNLNLNRDFAKADTPEMRAVIRALRTWQPDLVLDLHVTDGADYQYDITYGGNGVSAWSPAIEGWLNESLFASYQRDLSAEGHIPGRLVFAANGRDPTDGIVEWHAGPRYSNGYGDARALPTVLVENHSLKPYGQRVLGTYVLLESSLRTLIAKGDELRAAVAKDRARRPKTLDLAFTRSQEEPEIVDFLGVRSEARVSEITGRSYIEWTGEPIRQKVPLIRYSRSVARADRPEAYWIPPQWKDVVDLLKLHGIKVQRRALPRKVNCETYVMSDVELAEAPFEGRVRVSSTAEVRRGIVEFPVGSYRVSTNQPLGTFAMLLLEPDSPDSVWQWGFFHSVLQRTEYLESYVLEPLAAKMMKEDEKLRKEFQAKLESDPDFAASPRDRLLWFYRRSPYIDKEWNVYPIAREPTRKAKSTSTR